ncbi:methionyl-tRNA formyltransferase, mitochondrial-like [Clavelina lepadiformis]|uniref:methionyl-tRNA formyltransferase, mitochondrial-like n=1 Tax=Clavelina lepadiformis TaxID=159417 RepID=UPI004042E31A
MLKFKHLCQVLKWKQFHHNYRTYTYKPYNVLFFGTDDYALHCLKRLKSDFEKVPGTHKAVKKLEVVCLSQANVPVKKFALSNNLPLHTWPYMPKNHTFDVAVVVSFGKLIPERIIKTFPLGMINIHASFLPALRGAAPIARAVEKGLKETGVTIMQIKPNNYDHGLILDQSETVKIKDSTTSADLRNDLGSIGSKLCLEVLRELPLKLKSAKQQNESCATAAPKLTLHDTYVNWYSMDSDHIWKKYRAYGFDKTFHLRCLYNGTLVRLVHLSLCTEDQQKHAAKVLSPGCVMYHKKSKRLLIACKTGHIACEKLIVDKHKSMSAESFNNGYLQKQTKLNKKIVFLSIL